MLMNDDDNELNMNSIGLDLDWIQFKKAYKYMCCKRVVNLKPRQYEQCGVV